jgi:pimeloyl-ACP methyl ester carboxylesterase
MGAVVVYIHGLWLGGGESFLLRRRLARALGAEARAFAYSSLGSSVAENAVSLRGYLQKIPADTLHLVAHSLGGLVILKLFDPGLAADATLGRPAELPPGRVVLLGSPVRGSCSARRLARLPFGRAILGRPAADALLAPCEPRWQGDRELGVIAGDLSAGLGRLLGRLDGPNDGTVLADETQLPGATAQLRLHVSHSGMVFSAAVAAQTAAFLRDGRFERE